MNPTTLGVVKVQETKAAANQKQFFFKIGVLKFGFFPQVLPCRDYLRNRSRSKKRLLKDAQQSYVKHVARRSDPGLFGFTNQCLYCEKLCTDDKKHFDRKNFEIASILNTKIYTSALEISRDT